MSSSAKRVQRIAPRRPDFDVAKRFIKLLRLDREHETFQTFDDDRDRKSEKLARILHGHLQDHEDELERLNGEGAGVFIAVNVTDGRGRSRENIKRVRALCLDLDGAPLNLVLESDLLPHIVVESSPDRYHCYWLVADFPLDKYEDVQRGLARRFDGDPAVALLTHVARLPGFDHCKGDRFRTRIVQVNKGEDYAADEIIEEFPPEKRPHKAPTSRTVLSADSPMRSAEEFVTQVCMPKGAEPPAFGLHWYSGRFYAWDETKFRGISNDTVRARLYKFTDDCLGYSKKDGYGPFNPTPSKIAAIIDALKGKVLLPDGPKPPFWIDQEPVHDDTLLACRNGLVNVETGKLQPHSPLYFNVNCLPFDYDPDAPEPRRWFKFLDQVWPDDQSAQDTLQEMFGLFLTADTSHQKIFMLVGPKRAGKGTIGRVLTALLGDDNIASPTLASLNTNFGLSPLIDKRLALISDARLGASKDGSVVAERLLAISGEDGQQIDIKYAQHWQGKLAVRFMLMTNELPRITDQSGALTSRFILLVLKNSFYGREDLALTDKLLDELPGILNWAMDGLHRLRDRGHFVMPKSSNEAVRLLEDLTSPIGAFLRDWCEKGSGRRIPVKRLYDAWCKWADQHGHKGGSSSVFGRGLVAAEASIVARGRGSERFYQGVELSEEGEAEYRLAMREVA